MAIAFFVKRPIFAVVLSLLLFIGGAIAIPFLPIAQYPNIAPPQITVTAIYTGASAEVVESTVTTPLEQQINGVPGMRYIQSTSRNDGTSTITVTFEVGRNIDQAAIDVQNRVNTAEARLPEAVRRNGVRIAKTANQTVLVFGLYAPNGEYSNLFISNYADLYVRDALRRIAGVSEVHIYGERKYAMRIWLDPDRLAAHRLTAADVSRALTEQNLQVGAGQIGQPPAPAGQQAQLSVRVDSRLERPEQFAAVVLGRGPGGALVRVQDVGRVELGAEDYSTFMRFNGREAVGMAVDLLPGANALQVDAQVRAELARLAQAFPPGLVYRVAFDTTAIVDASIHEVLVTLAQAIALVVGVIFLFLQSWRTALVPVLTIPVSLVGTFLFVQLLGFSINTLTLFGITLATGLVVDDAIVVIENIARTAREKLLPAQLATIPAVSEVFGAVVATSLVLVAVFVPVAFFPGTTGLFYQQFALTIAVSIALSTFASLTLAPALAARIPDLGQGTIRGRLGWLFSHFERTLAVVGERYTASLKRLLQAGPALSLVLLALGLAATWTLLERVPRGFVPAEDQGYFVVMLQTPEGTSLTGTDRVLHEVEALLRSDPDIENVFAMGGFSFTGNAPNKASLFPNLKPLALRQGSEHAVRSVIERLRGPLAQIQGAIVVAFEPPAVQGLGNTGGFTFELEDRRNHTAAQLAETAWTLIGRASADPRLQNLFTSFSAATPRLQVRLDRQKARALGVSVEEVYSTLQLFLGSLYINDFEMFGRPYRVYAQADSRFRSRPSDIGRFYVRSETGQLLPLASLVQVSRTSAPQVISHHNLYRAVQISGAPAPGVSSAEALAAMAAIAAEVLPTGMGYEWSGLSLEQSRAGAQAVFIFVLGGVLVFLVLAAQYEQLAAPAVVLLSVPLALPGALGALALRGLENDIFAQIGFVMLIGLAAKNAILIVEFANQLRATGLGVRAAALEAARTRLRPILMTSLAFILGIVPLVLAEGAGAIGRQTLGTAVAGGMLVSTLLSLYLVPSLYVAILGWRERLKAPQRKARLGALVRPG